MDEKSLSVLSRFTHLVSEERRLRTELLRTLIEIEDRRIHLELGHSSVFTFLTERFGFSNASAYRRHVAAGLARRMPSVLGWLEQGRVSLKKLCLLKDVLTQENCESVLARAAALAETEVSALVSELKPEAPPKPRPDIIRPLPAPKPSAAQMGDLFTAAPDFTSTGKVIPPPAPLPAPEPRLHLVQMTVGPEFLATLEKVRAALSHQHAGAGMEELLLACMKTALEEHARKSRASVKKPRAPKAGRKEASRHVPAADKREVWRRDEGRCKNPYKAFNLNRSNLWMLLRSLRPRGCLRLLLPDETCSYRYALDLCAHMERLVQEVALSAQYSVQMQQGYVDEGGKLAWVLEVVPRGSFFPMAVACVATLSDRPSPTAVWIR